MLAFRIIARLDIRNEALIKTIRCEGVRKVGDPYEYAKRYDEAGIDEILYLDVVASLYGRNSLAELVEKTARGCFCPLTVAGGISDSLGAGELFRSGADKVGINSAATMAPEILGTLALKYGSQAVVLQLDAKRKNGSWEAYTHGARQPSGRNALEWAKEAVDRGAGEILVTSIDREGTRQGFDVELLREVASLPVPVVAAGGFGAPLHAVEAYKAGVSGIAIAGDLHYNRTGLDEIRKALKDAGAAVRMP